MSKSQRNNQASRTINRQAYAFFARCIVRLCPYTDSVVWQPNRYVSNVRLLLL